MEIAILGLPRSGKSTLFEMMTGIRSREIFGEQTVRGQAKVPDQRFSRLAEVFKPKKVSPALIPFIDTNVMGEAGWSSMRQILQGADGILHVLDAHTTTDIPKITSNYRKIADELVLSDLMVVENRMEKMAKTQKSKIKPEETIHAQCLPRAKEALDAGLPLRGLSFTAQELVALKGFSFWTVRPELIVVNGAEDASSLAASLSDKLGGHSSIIGIAGEMEMEIAQLSAEERAPFLNDLGIEEPAFEKIIRTAFSLLDQMVYFTVGEDEVKAWIIPKASTAPRAAAAIHQDFERGFIKAEVASFADFTGCGETLAGCKSAGKLRLEGKDYIVQDGDIISFRFNI